MKKHECVYTTLVEVKDDDRIVVRCMKCGDDITIQKKPGADWKHLDD